MTYIQMNACREHYRDLRRAADAYRAIHSERAHPIPWPPRFSRSKWTLFPPFVLPRPRPRDRTAGSAQR